MRKNVIVAAVATLAASFATTASAQSSATLYGLIDTGLTFVNNVATGNVNGPLSAAGTWGRTYFVPYGRQ